MEEINIKEFFQYYKKYLFRIGLVVLLFMTAVLVYDISIKTPLYTSKVSVVLVKDENEKKSSKSDNTIDTSDITLNQKLVSTYRRIVKSRLVLEQVISKLDLSYSFTTLDKEVSVKAIDDTEILEISVSDPDATKACDIANTIVEIFNKEVTNMYNINNVSVLDKALVASDPSNNTTVRDIILAALGAIFASSAIIFVIYYFDDRLRDTETIEQELEMPVIGRVYKDDSKIDLVVDKRPKSITSENIRTIRTNLQFSSIDKEIKTILVTSSFPGEGKSYISSNLATAFAQAGKKTLLIDCDLRKGRQHKIFKGQSKKGLSNLLIDDVKNYKDYIYQTKIDNLYVITRGIIPPNPSELLTSKKNITLLNELEKHFDVIILDGTPTLGLSDSLVLSSLVDKVIIVGSSNNTQKIELKNVKKSLEAVGADIAGCVINNIKANKELYGKHYYYSRYGYGYGYGSEYFEQPKKEK